MPVLQLQELDAHDDEDAAVDEQGFICASTAASSELGQRVLSYSTESAARVERVRCDGSKRFVLPTFVDCHRASIHLALLCSLCVRLES